MSKTRDGHLENERRMNGAKHLPGLEIWTLGGSAHDDSPGY